VDRIADARVLLAHNSSNALSGEPRGQKQPAGTAAHNEDVYQLMHATRAL
jgi:hypothetical protein